MSQNVTATQNFVPLRNSRCGVEITQNVQGTGEYNKINDLLATRTMEESGDYLVNLFSIDFQTDSENDNINKESRTELHMSMDMSFTNVMTLKQ